MYVSTIIGFIIFAALKISEKCTFLWVKMISCQMCILESIQLIFRKRILKMQNSNGKKLKIKAKSKTSKGCIGSLYFHRLFELCLMSVPNIKEATASWNWQSTDFSKNVPRMVGGVYGRKLRQKAGNNCIG